MNSFSLSFFFQNVNDDEYHNSSRYGNRHSQRGYDKGDYRTSNNEHVCSSLNKKKLLIDRIDLETIESTRTSRRKIVETSKSKRKTESTKRTETDEQSKDKN